MEQLVISVRPSQGGWSVTSPILAAPLMFLSGGKAERQAHCLGRAIALAGQRVEIAIYDLQNSLIAALALAPATPRFLQALGAAQWPSNDDWEHRRRRPRAVRDAGLSGGEFALA